MKAVAGVVVGLAIVGLAAWLLLVVLPGRDSAGRANGKELTAPPVPTRVNDAPRPEHRVDTPLNPEDRRKDDLAQQRLPYFRFLSHNFSDTIEKFAVFDTLDTLDVILYRDDDKTLKYVVQYAVTPSAHDYGFQKARFYVRNPTGSVEPIHVVAEATYDGSGRWNIFRK